MTRTLLTPETEKRAIGLYASMAFDPCDVLDEIAACEDAEALELLLEMLKHVGTDRTDRSLNTLFVGPVEHRLADLRRSEAS